VAEYVLALDEPGCHHNDVSGGKGASLARMLYVGMPVPPGFVVTAEAMSASLDRQGVLASVADLARSFDAGPGGADVATRIQEMVAAASLHEQVADEVSGAYADFGDGAFVAVRSSACAEDGEAASFAGQQETYLNVVGIDDVLDRVVECWASFFSERALFYRHRKGSLADLGMAVVVQRQIASDKSGVIFTVDPIRRRSDQMLIEAAYGLGEAVVSGLVTPDNYVARRDGTLKKVRVGRQDKTIVRDDGGGTTTVKLDEETATARVLNDDEIAHLVTAGIGLEEAFGSPQDIEWAIESDELYLLQSRPITA
jgi:pyruvate, water dikinase